MSADATTREVGGGGAEHGEKARETKNGAQGYIESSSATGAGKAGGS